MVVTDKPVRNQNWHVAVGSEWGSDYIMAVLAPLFFFIMIGGVYVKDLTKRVRGTDRCFSEQLAGT